MEQQLHASGEHNALLESDLSIVGDTFKSMVSQMKSGLPLWDDLIQRGLKFQRQLEVTIVAYNYFSEGFGKVADLAVRAKGGTRDMGTQLTTLVMWHKQLELKLRGLNQAFNTNFLTSMHGRIEEFRKSANTIEKECDRELKKSVNEAKEACTRTVKTSKNLAKKAKKEKFDEVQALKTELSKKQQEATDRIQSVYNLERRQLAKLLVEERTWYCTLIRDYMGVMNVGMSMVGDLQRLQDISHELSISIERPSVLPEKSIDYLAEVCPMAALTNDFQDSLSLGIPRSQISGSLTPQPVRSASSSSGLSRRSQSFDQIDDPALYYSEIPYTSQLGQPVSPLTVSTTPPPPVYDAAPTPPPPPVHKPSQTSLQNDNDVYVYPEQPPPPPPSAMTENGVPPPPVNTSPGWRNDLMAKLRKRAESVGSPICPSTPVEEQLYVEVETPSFVLSQRSMSVSSTSSTSVTNKVPQPMTPPTTHMRRHESQVPPPKLPKPSRMSVASYQDDSDSEDESPLAKALKGAKLKKTVSNDRSAPKM